MWPVLVYYHVTAKAQNHLSECVSVSHRLNYLVFELALNTHLTHRHTMAAEKNVLKSADLRVLTRLLHARAHILQWIYNYYLCATSCCNAERMFSFPGLRKMFIHEKINCTRPPIGALGQCSCVVKSCTYRQGKKWGNVPLGPGKPGWKRSEQHSSSNLCSWYQKDGTNF